MMDMNAKMMQVYAMVGIYGVIFALFAYMLNR